MKRPHLLQRIVALLLLLLIALVIYSCSRDSSEINPAPLNEDAKLIAEAKAYFESSQANTDSIKIQAFSNSRTPRQHQAKTMDWNKAYTRSLFTGKMVMVPLKYDSTLSITSRGNVWKLNKIARAYIFKDKSGTMRTQVVVRIPESYSMDKVPASGFSGLVIVEDWQGNTIKTIRFKNGKTSRMGFPVAAQSGKKVLAYKTNDITCETFSWGHCAFNGNTGEFYGCWEEGSEEVCYSGPGGVNPYEEEDEDYGDGGGGDCGSCNTTPPPVVTKEDPCNEKTKVSAKSQAAAVSAQNGTLLANLSTNPGIEYGTETNLTAWPNGSYMNIPVRTNSLSNTYTSRFTWNSNDGYTMGFSHSHPLGSAPSPGDIYTMVKSLSNPDLIAAGQAAVDFYKQNVTMTVVTDNGNYLVTITDWAAMEAFGNQFATDPNSFNQTYSDYNRDYGSSEAALLSMFGNAINVYKADLNSVEYKPLTLNSNNTVTIKPCP